MNPDRLRKPPNVAIVGSTSLIGKELRQMLDDRGWPVGRLTLLETEEYAGLLREFAGDIQITQVISPETLADVDIAFFTCSSGIMESYVASGARFPDLTIDLTQTGQTGILFLHGISATELLRRKGYYVNPHPAAIVLGRVLSELHNKFVVQSAAVTVLEPASERGNAGVDELQEQTVSLLNFQQLEKSVFTGQLAFNILPENENSARTESQIRQQLSNLLGETFPKPLLTVVQAPVFHSHAFSMFVQLLETPAVEQVAMLLSKNPHFSIDQSKGEPSPVGVVGTESIHVGRVQRLTSADAYGLWLVADNLRISASNAIQIAKEIILAPALDV
jgi:aspartate-semialdehyde dehydrogenase